MAKEKGEKRKRDEERKEKKVKRSDKHDDERKEDRKEKDKERSHKKKRRLTNGTDGDATAAAPVASEPAPPAVVESAPGTKAAADVRNGDAGDDNDKRNVKAPPPIGALVPFANPLADEKVQKKVLKSVSKAAKNKSIRRGVKEVVKCLRKSPAAGPASSPSDPPGVVVLAADISPMDVISHIPVLCEDHNIPYIYLTSRAQLGVAASTKRPTSVVLVTPERGGKKRKPAEQQQQQKQEKQGKQDKPTGADADADADAAAAEYRDVYKSLVKLVLKENQRVLI